MILLRRYFGFYLWLVAGCFPENAKLFSAAPDFLLISVFIFRLTLNFWGRFLLGAISGIIKDSFFLAHWDLMLWFSLVGPPLFITSPGVSRSKILFHVRWYYYRSL